MNLFVDTSVWSLAFRRAQPTSSRQVALLASALDTGGSVFTTGLVLQELLQGFNGPKNAGQLVHRFSAIPFLVADREDYIAAAELRNSCRRHGVQVGTIDALFAQLCIRHQMSMLTTDADFEHMALYSTLRLA